MSSVFFLTVFFEGLLCAIFKCYYHIKVVGSVSCDSNSISCGYDFLAENFGDGRRIPTIIYPINNTIEAQLGE